MQNTDEAECNLYVMNVKNVQEFMTFGIFYSRVNRVYEVAIVINGIL